MPEQPCLPQVQACIIRVAKLTPTTYAPLVGASNGYISNALVSLAFAPVYEDGAEITQDNACGAKIIDYKAPDVFRRAAVTISLATPDPYLAAFLSGGTVLVGSGADLNRVGWSAPALGTLAENPVSIELWAKRVDKATGGQDALSPWAKWVYPLVKNLRIGDYTQENGALLPSFTGQAYENPLWGNGPWDDWLPASDRVVQWMPASTIPTAVCGPVAVAVQVP